MSQIDEFIKEIEVLSLDELNILKKKKQEEINIISKVIQSKKDIEIIEKLKNSLLKGCKISSLYIVSDDFNIKFGHKKVQVINNKDDNFKIKVTEKAVIINLNNCVSYEIEKRGNINFITIKLKYNS